MVSFSGLIGVNLWPLQDRRRYLLCPRSMFFEFLPEEHLDTQHTLNTLSTLLMDEVEEGKNYELIITNASGLFRYCSCNAISRSVFRFKADVCVLIKYEFYHCAPGEHWKHWEIHWKLHW